MNIIKDYSLSDSSLLSHARAHKYVSSYGGGGGFYNGAQTPQHVQISCCMSVLYHYTYCMCAGVGSFSNLLLAIAATTSTLISAIFCRGNFDVHNVHSNRSFSFISPVRKGWIFDPLPLDLRRICPGSFNFSLYSTFNYIH